MRMIDADSLESKLPAHSNDSNHVMTRNFAVESFRALIKAEPTVTPPPVYEKGILLDRAVRYDLQNARPTTPQSKTALTSLGQAKCGAIHHTGGTLASGSKRPTTLLRGGDVSLCYCLPALIHAGSMITSTAKRKSGLSKAA